METIDVSIIINAPIEKVFDALSDHESYKKITGILSAKLLKPGDTEKNGKGAIRQLDGIGITFIEEIPAFERNKYYEYKVLECYLNLGLVRIEIPLIHELGRITLQEKEDGVEVRWISIIDLNIPFAKEIATKFFAFHGSDAFVFMLRQMKHQLEDN